MGVRLAADDRALSDYVADAIDFSMEVEQPLYFSDNCFGTPDTISFVNNYLRIHDLKTGIVKASMKQLLVYAALFCLEYGFSPFGIEMELRIYQEDVEIHIPDPDEVAHIMDVIIASDRRIELLKGGVIQ